MAENGHNTCHRGGRLVGPRFEIPKPAFDFVWPEGDAFFGCNHLVDGEGRRVKSKVRGVARVYSAGDRTETVTGMQWVEDERMTDLGHFLPWTCGGHPQVKLPLKLDGEIIDGETDWAALTKGVVEGTRAKSRPEFANRHAVSWLLRMWATGRPFVIRCWRGSRCPPALRWGLLTIEESIPGLPGPEPEIGGLPGIGSTRTCNPAHSAGCRRGEQMIYLLKINGDRA